MNAADATEVNETEAFKKPSCNLADFNYKNKSFKNPIQHGRLTDKNGGYRKNPGLGLGGFST